MSTKLKHQETPANNVTALTSRCAAEGCTKKSEQLNFCTEHFAWFKFGLITKEGKHPVDFDKKYAAYKKHHNAA